VIILQLSGQIEDPELSDKIW